MTAPSHPLLRAQGLTRRFGGLLAVSNLHFAINPGEILGLIGPNGGGKSTTFNLISGFYPLTAGKLFVDERQVTGAKPAEIARLGITRTFQHGSLMRGMSVRDNILVGAIGCLPKGSARERQARVEETAALLGLSAHLGDMAGTLPHGLQRLVSIAIGFATRPRLLCLDEPLTGLNQTEVVRTLDVFARIRSEFGCSILLVEHNMKAVMQICDRIVVLHHGQLLATGSPQEVRNNPTVISAYLGGRHAA